jgi:DNA topoisomerase-2
MAFNKQRADDRKAWLQGYDKSALIPPGNLRCRIRSSSTRTSSTSPTTTWSVSIPSVMDGLKASQRKILYRRTQA